MQDSIHLEPFPAAMLEVAAREAGMTPHELANVILSEWAYEAHKERRQSLDTTPTALARSDAA